MRVVLLRANSPSPAKRGKVARRASGVTDGGLQRMGACSGWGPAPAYFTMPFRAALLSSPERFSRACSSAYTSSGFTPLEAHNTHR